MICCTSTQKVFTREHVLVRCTRRSLFYENVFTKQIKLFERQSMNGMVHLSPSNLGLHSTDYGCFIPTVTDFRLGNFRSVIE